MPSYSRQVVLRCGPLGAKAAATSCVSRKPRGDADSCCWTSPLPPCPVGQVQQAHVQLPGGKSLASAGETPAPFGKTPRAVFLSLLSSMRAEEAAGFHSSAINKNEANESDFQKEKILLLSRETHDSGHDMAFALRLSTF